MTAQNPQEETAELERVLTHAVRHGYFGAVMRTLSRLSWERADEHALGSNVRWFWSQRAAILQELVDADV